MFEVNYSTRVKLSKDKETNKLLNKIQMGELLTKEEKKQFDELMELEYE